MNIDLFINSLFNQLNELKNIKDLFDLIRNNKKYLSNIELFFENNSKIFDVINNSFLDKKNIEYKEFIELNNKSRILINFSNNHNIQLIISSLKICVENIKLNNKKLEIQNIDSIINFASNISIFSTKKEEILDYTLEFCNKIFNSENSCVFLYNENEATITNSYKNKDVCKKLSNLQ